MYKRVKCFYAANVENTCIHSFKSAKARDAFVSRFRHIRALPAKEAQRFVCKDGARIIFN